MSQKYIHTSLIGVVIVSIFSLLLHLHFFESWQMRLSDTLFTPREATADIVIIAIDDKSIQKVGRWPWDRTIHAKLINLIGPKAKVIGLDVSFPEPSKQAEFDEQLIETLTKFSNVILPVTSNSFQTQKNLIILKDYLYPFTQLAKVVPAGLVNMSTDIDNVTRQTPVTIKTEGGESLDNFSVAIVKKYLGIASLPFIPSDQGQLRINFIGMPGSFKIYSYIDVLDNIIPVEIFKDKIVLIGATALDLHDTLTTPVSQGIPMSGVEVHANVIQTILEKDYLRLETELFSVITIILLGIISTMFFSRFGVIAGTVGLFGMIIIYIVYTIYSFDNGIIRNLVYPILTLITTFITQLAYKYIVENKQKRFIKKALSYYLSNSVMQEILSHPDKLTLGGIRKKITVLFSDIAGFTTISEKISPEKLAHLLNQYLTQMTNIVFTHSGVLDKYIGDAVMAFWGAPLDEKNHAMLACKAAIEMQKKIGEIKIDWEKEGVGDLAVRIGINTGDMVVGNMGSDLRFDYTLLGDNVNLGSRLEGINKEYNTQIIISGSTYESVKGEIIARQLDLVAVKGKAKGIAIYELRGLGNATGSEMEFLESFENARKLYSEGDFGKAREAFLKIKKMHPQDYPTLLYIRRCTEFLESPPSEWDGIYHATSK